jgi:hypothetical protein
MATVRSWELTNTLKDWRSWEKTSLGGDLYSWEVIFEARGDTGVFAGGFIANPTATITNTIECVSISTISNATDFGDMTAKTYQGRATSNGLGDRAVIHTGYLADYIVSNTINYITITSPSNASIFGSLTQSRTGGGACSNRTNDRGVFCCGWNGSITSNVMDYITMSTTGGASDFGDITEPFSDHWLNGGQDGTSNGENNRGIFVGIITGNYPDPPPWHPGTIRYITINSLGNSINFGWLAIGAAYGSQAICSNGTRNRACLSCISKPFSATNAVEYITINSASNSLDFGDLLAIMYGACAGTSNCSGQRGVYFGGTGGDEYSINTISYITISTLGDAADFGDLTTGRDSVKGASNA